MHDPWDRDIWFWHRVFQVFAGIGALVSLVAACGIFGWALHHVFLAATLYLQMQ